VTEHAGNTNPSRIAALLMDAESLTALWCNEEYPALVETSQEDIIGKPYENFAPAMATSKVPIFHEVATGGEARQGTDYQFDLAKGSIAIRWQVHRPVPGMILVLLLLEQRPGAEP
jgi:hypothetical protein